MTWGVYETEPAFDWRESRITAFRKRYFFEIALTLREEDRQSDSHRVGMAAPRPIKGILKNKNSAPNVKPVPDEVPPENLEKAPGLSEDDQQ